MGSVQIGRGRAASYLARVNMEIVKAAGARRQGHLGRGAGARPPAALGGDRVQLVELQRPRGGDRQERITPPGYRTARRAPPRLLAQLPEADPRRQVAQLLADAVERVGAVKGVDLAGSDSKGGVSDGGATTRVKHAARLRLIEALANRWPIDRRHGPRRGAARVLLAVKRGGSKRQNIKAFDALLALCVEGASVDAILRAHGWSAQAFNRTPLRDAILEALDDVAAGLGLGRGAGKDGS